MREPIQSASESARQKFNENRRQAAETMDRVVEILSQEFSVDPSDVRVNEKRVNRDGTRSDEQLRQDLNGVDIVIEPTGHTVSLKTRQAHNLEGRWTNWDIPIRVDAGENNTKKSSDIKSLNAYLDGEKDISDVDDYCLVYYQGNEDESHEKGYILVDLPSVYQGVDRGDISLITKSNSSTFKLFDVVDVVQAETRTCCVQWRRAALAVEMAAECEQEWHELYNLETTDE